MSSILVIDLGTTYFKLALFGRDGQLRASTRIAVRFAGQSEGRAELAVEEFEALMAEGVANIRRLSEWGLADIEAVTFATQSNSFVLLDGRDRPVTPLILWPDRRAIAFDADVRDSFAASGQCSATGVPFLGHQSMLAKLLWLRSHQPEAWAPARRLCLISDYLTLLFTGRHVTEAGAAGLTGLLDIGRGEWLPEIINRFEIPPRWLAEIVRAATDLGPISPAASEQWGLPASCRFIVGCLDQYAGAIGAGNVEPDRVSETTGTVLATVRCADRFTANLPATVYQGPGFRPGQYFQMTYGDTSAVWLEWLRNREPGRPSYDDLVASAADVAPGADGLRLRPGGDMSSEAEVFFGLTPEHTRGHKVRCILEAVAAALREQVHTLCGDNLPEEIRSVGGAARSPLWRQIKADMLGVDVTAVDCAEPTCLGAALVAEACLRGTDLRHIAPSWIHLAPPLPPNPDQHRLYQALAF